MMRLTRTLALAVGMTFIAGAAHAATIQLDRLERGSVKVNLLGRDLKFEADESGKINRTESVIDSRGREMARIVMDVVLEADPFISYGTTVLNFSSSPLAFAITYSSPYIDGPWDILDSSHSSSVTDNNRNGNVTVTTSGFVHTPHVDSNVIPGTSIGTGCNVSGTPGFSGTCHTSSFFSVPITPTPGTGTFDVAIALNLSARDIWTGNGRVELRSSVPDEVSTALLLVLAVGVMVVARGHLVRA